MTFSALLPCKLLLHPFILRPVVSQKLTTGELKKRTNNETLRKDCHDSMDEWRNFLPSLCIFTRTSLMTIPETAIGAMLRSIQSINEQLKLSKIDENIDESIVKSLIEAKESMENTLKDAGYRTAGTSDFKIGATLFCRIEGWKKELDHLHCAGMWETTCKNTVVFESDASSYLVKGK